MSNYEAHEQSFANNVPALITTNIGLMAAAQGDIEVALEATRRAVLQGPTFLFNVWIPLMKDVRATSEFARLMTELGLPAFWSANGWPEHCGPTEPEGFACD